MDLEAAKFYGGGLTPNHIALLDSVSGDAGVALTPRLLDVVGAYRAVGALDLNLKGRWRREPDRRTADQIENTW